MNPRHASQQHTNSFHTSTWILAVAVFVTLGFATLSFILGTHRPVVHQPTAGTSQTVSKPSVEPTHTTLPAKPVRPAQSTTAPPTVIVVELPASQPAVQVTQQANQAVSPTTNQATTGQDPATVLSKYYQDLNSHDYLAAWNLGAFNIQNAPQYDSMPQFNSWVAGYSDTAHVALTILSVSGNQVNVTLLATAKNGDTIHYSGTYTVTNGMVTAADIS